ncbi:MAG: tyrosine-type recombinase/integrase [Rhodobacteraceae bacterium]|nr:tyrosine-type recombinase/integrase [Paracoccaceae bacterium]
MTKTKLKGINTTRKRLADGSVKLYYYHRASGARLPGVPGSASFLAAYVAAEDRSQHLGRTVSGLIRAYIGSPRFKQKAASTQREYIRMLSKLKLEFGKMKIAALSSLRVRGVFISYQEKIAHEHPREADNRLSVLSSVFSYAVAKGEIRDNPIKGFQRLHKGDRSQFIWTEKDIAAFMASAPMELQQALILAIHTGQCYGDLIRLRWSDYEDGALRLRQSKTGVHVHVPASRALQRMLDGMERRGPYILTRADGRPWFTQQNDKALSKAWSMHARSVGIDKLHFHDLRGTAVTLMNEAGVTLQQTAAVTGHTMQSATRILERYGARTRALAAAAIETFENAEATVFANQLQTKAQITLGEQKDHE